MKRFLFLLISFLFVINFFTVAEGQKESTEGKTKKSTIVFNTVHSGPIGEVLKELGQKFGEKYPNIDLKINIAEHETGKTMIRMWVTDDNPPDVIGWQSGEERFHFFTRQGLVKDITEFWEEKSYDDFISRHLKSSVSSDGKVYAIPSWVIAGYGWHYNKPTWNDYGFNEPSTWEEFKTLSDTMQGQDLTPISMGIRHEVWKTGDMFDYMNMRINGLEWYRKLLKLQESYASPEVYEVMRTWKELIDAGYYNDDFPALNRTEAFMRVVQGKAGMFFGGSYEIRVFEDPENCDAFQFPIIDPDVPVGELWHHNLWFIPEKAKNPEGAKLWLDYLISEEAQTYIAENDPSNPIPANQNVPEDIYSNELMQKMLAWVDEADGIMHFYDRDTYAPMYEKGYEAFAEFMMNPENYKQIMQELDKYRKRYAEEYK